MSWEHAVVWRLCWKDLIHLSGEGQAIADGNFEAVWSLYQDQKEQAVPGQT